MSNDRINATGIVPPDKFRSLSVPVYRGSTLLYPDYKSFAERGANHRSGYSYGLAGTPTTRTLQSRLTVLEQAHDTFLVPSGLMAITTVFLAVCKSGDTVLIPDNVYPPVRRFAATTLRKMEINAVYYDPTRLHAVPELTGNVALVWAEVPGSTTMEVADITELRSLADRCGALLGCDNSWASPLLCTPLQLGADIVIEALTKYLSGHSDVLMGSISVSNETSAALIYETIRSLGVGVSPDDCSMVLRGMETAEMRLSHIGGKAVRIATELSGCAVVEQVLCPALPDSQFHALWERQFRGASGLFSIILAAEDDAIFAARFDQLEIFKLGASWGGNHSILAPVVLDKERTINRIFVGRQIVRISIGLEDEDKLTAELCRNFGKLDAAGQCQSKPT